MLEAVVRDGTDAGPEYEAMRKGAVAIDRSLRGRWRLSGPKAAETLTGLVTNDVLALAPGHGQYAAVLTPKGKIIADVVIARLADGCLVDVPSRAAAGFGDVIRKYVNPRATPYVDESATTCDIGVHGARAGAVTGVALGLSLETLLGLPAYGHLAIDALAPGAIVTRLPTLAHDGFAIRAGIEVRDTLWARLAEAGAGRAGPGVWDVARVEAGLPEWGIDIDESTIPQEAGLDALGAISYTKGCYTGQETVARIHFRGHVNRLLRGLRLDGAPLPNAGSQLLDAEGKPVGDLRSIVRSPRFGPIALGMVRREIDDGTVLTASWVPASGGLPLEARATVGPLPFTRG